MTQPVQRERTPKSAPVQPIIQITPDLLAEALKLAGIEEKVSERIDGAVRAIQQFAVALDGAIEEAEPPRPPLPADLEALEQTIAANDAAAATALAASADARRQLVDEVAILRRENAKLYAALNGTTQTIRETEAAWHAGQPDMAKLFGTVRVNEELCEQHDADLRAFYQNRDQPRCVDEDLAKALALDIADNDKPPQFLTEPREEPQEPGRMVPRTLAAVGASAAALILAFVAWRPF